MSNETEEFQLSTAQMNEMLGIIAQNPRDFFLSQECRRYLARNRFEERGRGLQVHTTPSEGVMPGTIAHNRGELDTNAFESARRTLRLINPLSAMEPVYSNPIALKVLSIGPRTEMELIHLIGIGFAPANIHAVDLISSSPMIEVGDMHQLRYADRSFDVVISSWCLPYSDQPQRAVDEMVRVTRQGGLVAIGATFDPKEDPKRAGTRTSEKDILGSAFSRTEEFMTLLGNHVSEVCFQHNPPNPKRMGPVMLIARISHSKGP